MTRIAFACGGSVGHIAPCVAVWRAVQKREPDAECVFLCSSRPEDAAFLQKENIPFLALGSRTLTFWNALPQWIRARRFLRHFRPAALFSKGGGVTIPAALAARALRIPIIVHESDAVRGRATRMIAPLALHVREGFPGANPVRTNVMRGSKERGLRLTGFGGARPVLLVMGGSQGAAAINDVTTRHLDELLQFVDVAHLTGEGKHGAAPRAGYWSSPFAHETLPDLYAIADAALSRAGAGSIGELAANGIATILVPLRGLAHDHQEANARALEQKGACLVLEQDVLNMKIVDTIRQIMAKDAERKNLGEKLHTLSDWEAADGLAALVLQSAHA